MSPAEQLLPVWHIKKFVFLKGEEITRWHKRHKTSSYHCKDCGLPINTFDMESHSCEEEKKKYKL